MKTIHVRFHNGKIPDHTIGRIPDNVPAVRVVEVLQRRWARTMIGGRIPGCTWRIVKGGLVAGMIEGARS